MRRLPEFSRVKPMSQKIVFATCWSSGNEPASSQMPPPWFATANPTRGDAGRGLRLSLRTLPEPFRRRLLTHLAMTMLYGEFAFAWLDDILEDLPKVVDNVSFQLPLTSPA